MKPGPEWARFPRYGAGRLLGTNGAGAGGPGCPGKTPAGPPAATPFMPSSLARPGVSKHARHGNGVARVGFGRTFLRLTTLAAAGLMSSPAPAHDLQYAVGSGQAVVIRMFYLDDKPFSFEGYEIYRQGEKLPYQVGRSDAQGRIAFLPDRAATWRIKAVSEDGHGLDFTLATAAGARIAATDKPFYERYGRIAAGLAVLLGLFGLLKLYVRRKKPS